MSQTGKIEVSQKEDLMYRIQPVQIDWKPDKSGPTPSMPIVRLRLPER